MGDELLERQRRTLGQTLKVLEHTDAPPQPESLDAIVMDEERSSRLFLQTGREAAHLAIGVGVGVAGVLAYQIVPSATGLVYEASIAVKQAVVESFVQIVTHYPVSMTMGAVLAPALAVRYLHSRHRSLGKWGAAATALAGAALGVSISYVLPSLADTGSKLLASVPRWTQGLEAHLPGAIGAGLGVVLLPKILPWTKDNKGRTIPWRDSAAAIVGAGAGASAGVALVSYGPAIVDTVASFVSRYQPSLDTVVNSLPEAGAIVAGAGTLLYISKRFYKGENRSWGYVADILIGGMTGFAMYNGDKLFGILMGLSGSTGYIAGRVVIRHSQQISSALRSTGRTFIEGAAISTRYAARTFSTALDAVTPSKESLTKHQGKYLGGLVLGGVGLVSTAAMLEPLANTVTHSVAEYGIAGAIAGAAVAGGVGALKAITMLKNYFLGNSQRQR